MSDSILFLVLGAIIGGAGMMLVVIVVSWLRSSSEETELPSSGLVGQSVERASAPRDAAAQAAPAGMDEVLRVWRSPLGEEWEIEFQWRRYRWPADVLNEDAKRELLSVLDSLAAFGSEIDREAPGEYGPPPASAEALASPGQQPLTPPSPAPVTPGGAEADFSRPMQPPPPEPAGEPTRGIRLFGFGDRKSADDAAGSPATPSEPPEGLGIVGPIEKALQRRLGSRPDMHGREIHIGSAPNGSLRVEVDGRFYPGIDEVPDPIVRELLQAAVKDWEEGL